MDKVKKERIYSFARNVYFVGAMIYIGYSCVGTLQKMVDNRVITSISERELTTFTFPSITFCYPFNNFGHEMKRMILELNNNHGMLEFQNYFR